MNIGASHVRLGLVPVLVLVLFAAAQVRADGEDAADFKAASQRTYQRLSSELRGVNFHGPDIPDYTSDFLYGHDKRTIRKRFPVVHTKGARDPSLDPTLGFPVPWMNIRLYRSNSPDSPYDYLKPETIYSRRNDETGQDFVLWWDGSKIVVKPCRYSITGELKDEEFAGLSGSLYLRRITGTQSRIKASLDPPQPWHPPRSASSSRDNIFSEAYLLVDFSEEVVKTDRIKEAKVYFEYPLGDASDASYRDVVIVSISIFNWDNLQPEVQLINEKTLKQASDIVSRIVQKEFAGVVPITQGDDATDTPAKGAHIAAPETVAVVSATIAAVLIAAGIAAQIANAIAAALAQAVQSGAELTSEEISNAIAEGLQRAEPVPAVDGQPPPPPMGPALYDKEGKPFARNEQGEYWAPNEKGKWVWMGEDDAREASAALRGERAARETEIRHHDRETHRILHESREKILARNQAEEEALRHSRMEQAMEDERRRDVEERLVALMRRRAEQEGGSLAEEVGKLIADGNFAGLESLCRDELKNDIVTGQASSVSEQTYEKALAAGETLARATLAASRAALMSVGGPAGTSATALAVGTVSAFSEGTESIVRGGSLPEFLKHTAVGFLSGSKDGALSVYTNLPGASQLQKVLVPAAGDSLETFVRTGGNVKKSLSTGLNSLVGGFAGEGVSKLNNGAAREAMSAAVTMAGAEAGNYVNGGRFGDAYQNALINHVGGKLGGHLGGMAADRVTVVKPREPVVNHEDEVRAALDAMKAGRKPIPLEEQGELIQELDQTRHREAQLDESGRPLLDDDGNPVTTEYVDARKTLQQLGHTDQSRDAKLAPDDVREATIRTRADKIYKPADDATIRRVIPILKQNNMLQKDDQVVMDTFSTPGEKPSLGADRDARLVIRRPAEPDLDAVAGNLRKDNVLAEGDTLVLKNSPDRDPSRPPGTDPLDQVLVVPKGASEDSATPLDRQLWEKHDHIEIDRKHWERIAQEEFFKHTSKIATSDGSEVTPESHPEYFRRREELGFMRRPDTPEAIAALQARGYSQEEIALLQQQCMTQEQIDAQAWAEAHNQLFTDRHHMEASADNADQGYKVVEGQLEKIQKEPNVMGAKAGKDTLADPEGAARMWSEKSHFYDHNEPEAIAQSQKGIEGLMKLRKGYRTNPNPMSVPPIDKTMAKAMSVVLEAPVGVKATPEAMARVEADLQDLGFQDINDALHKIAMQNELLKWSRPENATAPVELPTREVIGSEHREIDTSDLSRIAGMDRSGDPLEEGPEQ